MGEVPEAVGRAVEALGDPRSVPDLRWIERLTGSNRESVENVLAEVGELITVERAIRSAHLAGGRVQYAAFRAPFELYAMVRLTQPTHVVETGVSSGVSSAHVLLALLKNRSGTLHSIDLPTRQRDAVLGTDESIVSLPPGRATGWAIPESLTGGWDLRIGPSQEVLPKLCEEVDRIGLFLHDSLHTPTHLTFELATARPRFTEGSIVLADNTVWTGISFPRFAKTLGVPVVRRGRTDLVGLRFPADPRPAVTKPRRTSSPRTRRPRRTRSTRATRSR